MRFWGKLIGFFLGYLLGNPFGALLGLYFGHKLDLALKNSDSFEGLHSDRSVGRQDEYFYATFSVMGHIAKAKGVVTEQEIQVANHFMDKMALHGEARKKAQTAFSDGKQNNFAIEKTMQSFRRLAQGRRDLLQIFLEVQLQAAFANNELHPTERKILHVIARELGFSNFELERLLNMLEAERRFNQKKQQRSSRDDIADAYDMLGIQATESDAEVKRHYRKLMNQHHPDKLVAKGLPPEMMELAKTKAQDIQQAYETIKKSRSYR